MCATALVKLQFVYALFELCMGSWLIFSRLALVLLNGVLRSL